MLCREGTGHTDKLIQGTKLQSWFFVRRWYRIDRLVLAVLRSHRIHRQSCAIVQLKSWFFVRSWYRMDRLVLAVQRRNRIHRQVKPRHNCSHES